ncbi:MAG: NAD(P)-binding protein [Proteobacteria bacterium]|nr:NAD(P)-binding protein [Pseudomonadota bacterium]
MANQSVCIIGGGIAGVGTWWTLAQPDQPGNQWDVTIIHDAARFGGHALTVPVTHNGGTTLVDTGVQFYVPMFYPNIDVLTGRPGIAERVPVARYDSLKVACGFPRLNGAARNWGNFDAYRGGADFAMYTPAMYRNAQRFQDTIDGALLDGDGSKTVAEYFGGLTVPYEQQQQFLSYFIDPYLSIINGYGAALSNQVTMDDLVPLFANLPGKYPGLGSFTNPGAGYGRFLQGASSLVEALAAQAQQLKPATAWMNTTVLSVAPAGHLPGPVTVTWQSGQGPIITRQFDKVIITTDILTAAGLLKSGGGPLWDSLYSKYLDKKDWQLQPGKCYIHSDVNLLSPDLRQQQETLQFTAYYAAQAAPPYYDMFHTYTTYLQQNIHNTPESAGLYLTMYGYIPDPGKGHVVPRQDLVLFAEDWQHGMWLPTFMMQAKRALHMAQGKGAARSYPGQLDTGIYFAGNNTTADSLEHAFISGEIIANWACGARYPLTGLHPLAWAMYEIFYQEFMFPMRSVSERLAHLGHALMRHL